MLCQIIEKFKGIQKGDKGLEFYNRELKQALENEKYTEVYREATQKQENYYPLGTTAILKLYDQKYILFALTKTELQGYIPEDNCDVSDMWISLEKFWSEARKKAWGESINIPLVGSGVTGIVLSPNRILELNLLAIVNAIQKMGKSTDKEIRIILYPKYLKHINLSDFQNIWS